MFNKDKASDKISIRKMEQAKDYLRVALILSLCIVVITVISLFFTSLFTGMKSRETRINEMESLQNNIIHNINIKKQNYIKTALNVINNNSIYSYISGQNTNINSKFNAMTELSQIKQSENMNSIIIHNMKNNTFWKSEQMEETVSDTFIKENKDFAQIMSSPEKHGFILCKDYNIVYFSYTDYRGYTIYFSLPKTDFSSSIFSINPTNDYYYWVYYDDLPLITSYSPNKTNFLFENISNIESNGEKSFHIYQDIIYTYTKSNNILCVTGQQNTPYFKYGFITNIPLILFYMFIIIISSVSIIIISKTLRKFYIDDSNKIASYTYFSSDIFKNSTLRKCFLQEGLTQMEENILSDFICTKGKPIQIYAVFLHINSTDTSETVDMQDINLIKYGLCNIINEYCNDHFISKSISLYKFSVGIAAVFYDDKVSVKEYIKEMRTNIGKAYNLSMSISVSMPFNDSNKFINAAYTSITLNNYRFFTGLNSDIFAQDIRRDDSASDYPKKLQDKIISNINAHDKEAFTTDYKEFIMLIQESCDLEKISWLYTLLINILNHTEIHHTILLATYIKELSDMETLSQAEEYIKNIVNCLFEEEISANITSDSYFSYFVEKETNENFSNPDYCLQSIAQKLNISTIYAGRKFKKIFDKSFNVYIGEYRINSSLELLKNPSLKIMDVATQCGFNSSTYFVTTFKKYRNITPQQYRNNLIKSASESL